MADGYFTPTTHAALIPETWRKEIYLALYDRMVMRGLVSEIKVPPGTDTLHFPSIAKLVAEEITPGTALVGNVNTEAVIDLVIDQFYGVPSTISKQTLIQIQQNIDVMGLYRGRSAEALAYQVDQALLGLYSGLTQTIEASGDITAAHISAARRLLTKAGAPQNNRYLVISPEQEEAMLAIASFIQAERYGSSAPIQEGEIGKVYGFNVVVSDAVITSTTRRNLAFHRDAFLLGVQQDVAIDVGAFDPLKQAHDMVASILYGYAEMRDTFACEITTTD